MRTAIAALALVLLWGTMAQADIWQSRTALEEFCKHRIYHRDCRILTPWCRRDPDNCR